MTLSTSPQPEGSSPTVAAILALIGELDVEDLVLRFDVDFDVPMRQEDALRLLTLTGVLDRSPQGDVRDTARRVGAHWCEIVRADVAYRLFSGLQLIKASRADAQWLHDLHRRGGLPADDLFAPYALARWFDAEGRIRYRLGSFTSARISFGTAVDIAREAGLWWALPDLRSNRERARFEEQGQPAREGGKGSAAAGFVAELEAVIGGIEDLARRHGVDVAVPPVPGTPARHREFLRGYSNALHNLAIALREAGRPDRSLEVTARSLAISQGLGDSYRIAQSRTNQVLCDPDNARSHFEELLTLPWERGKSIARQNLALRDGGASGLAELGRLLDEAERYDSADGHHAGLDVDFYAYTVRGYQRTAAELPPADRPDDVLARRLRLARSVRSAIALPAYKRAYARHMRPAFLHAIADAVVRGDGSQGDQEKILSLVEESSGRELLDLLGSSRPSSSGPPAHRIAGAPSPAPAGGGGPKVRAALQPASPELARALREVLAEREREYEERFLDAPLTSVAHDEDVAHRLVQYTLNHPGSCVVRYFRYAAPDGAGPGAAAVPDALGMMVCRDGRLTTVPGIPYENVARLADQVWADISDPASPWPSEQTCRRMWDLLVAPVWDRVGDGGATTHLTLIPTDHLFALPLHVAVGPGDTRPLAARVPLSHSVSVAAFVTQGRHLLKRQLMEDDDDLAALLSTDSDASGRELVGTGWRGEHVVVAGTPPEGLEFARPAHAADWDGLGTLVAREPEFFVYAGHGTYLDGPEAAGPLLHLGGQDVLTQFDLALHLSLPRNKLTVLGACVAGQGMRSDGGDVLGFMRSLVISGAGAVCLPLWYVLDTAMVGTVRALLAGSRQVLGDADAAPFDVVQALHEHYLSVALDYPDLAGRIQHMPLALYL
ncbi:CHAT domain-containing protein [Streptomyces sp. NPDC088733]|uniref:CHAT domain-containing protein n=1 Tax=Streptomyces sp. NPDC088733 TaxID=3365880 RepID=UPI0037F4A895